MKVGDLVKYEGKIALIIAIYDVWTAPYSIGALWVKYRRCPVKGSTVCHLEFAGGGQSIAALEELGRLS